MKPQPSARRYFRSRRSLHALAGFLRPESGAERPETRIDWPAVLLLANEHLLAPAVFVALKRSDRLSELPAEVRAYLGRLHRLNRTRNRSLRKQAIELAAACNARDVPVMVLKGAATLFDPISREPGARMVHDIDLMVREPALAMALSAFEAIGYRAAHRYPSGRCRRAELARPGSAGAVLMHVAPPGPLRFLRADEMWQRASIVRIEGATLWLPRAEDRILHNILLARSHGAEADSGGDIELRQIHDLALRAPGHVQFDWQDIESRMRAAGLGVLLESHLLTARRLFGMTWPLSQPPGWRAAIHHRRCMIQILVPALAPIVRPWDRLLGALTGRRLHAPSCGPPATTTADALPLAWRSRRRRLDRRVRDMVRATRAE